MQPLQETDFWNAPFSYQYEWGCLPQFPTELPPTAVARCRSADWDSVTVHAWRRYATFSSRCLGILEERVSGKCVARGGPTVWPACFSDCIPLHFDLLGHLKCTVCATDVSEGQDLGRTQYGFEMIRKSWSSMACDSRCSDAQRPARKLSVDTSRNLLQSSGGCKYENHVP